MKLAILTLPLHTNYGGILQAYALQTVLERLGHEVVVLNRPLLPPYIPLWKAPLVYGKRLAKKILIDHSIIVFYEWRRRIRLYITSHEPIRFTRAYIHNRWMNSPVDLRPDEVDGIVVGSDQIWRPAYLRGWCRNLADGFLRFARDWKVKRWAYAASFGVDTWEFPAEQTPEYAELAQLFEAFSVREDTGVALCREYLHVEAQHLLDPTLLLTPEDYQALIAVCPRRLSPSVPHRLTTYILDPSPEKQSLIEQIANERGLTPQRVGLPVNENNRTAPLSQRIYPPIEAWLKGMAEAEFVVTDSFHGAIFSFIFRKPFIVIGNPGRGLSRMDSLLRQFHAEDHLLLSTADYQPQHSYALPADIDTRYAALRQQSLDFLQGIR